MAGNIKLKFSTDYRMRGDLYRQGKSYSVPSSMAGNLIWNGVAVRAPQNAKKEAPESVVDIAAADTSETEE